MCFFKNHQITIQTMRGKQHKSISLGRQMWAEGGSWRKGGVLVRRPIAPTRRICPRTAAPTRRIRPSVPRSLSARCPAHPEARARSAPPRLPGKSAPPPHLPGDTPRHLTPLGPAFGFRRGHSLYRTTHHGSPPCPGYSVTIESVMVF